MWSAITGLEYVVMTTFFNPLHAKYAYMRMVWSKKNKKKVP